MTRASDTYYRQRAARRTRTLLLGGGTLLLVTCIALTVIYAFHDTCTGSFDRRPQSVIAHFVDGVTRGNWRTVVRCWEHDAFYDLESGCSEICLGRIMGVPYQGVEVTLSAPYPTDEGRSHILATVTITCPNSGEQHSGEILLDTIGAEVPWRHWKIIRSDLGGSIAAPWCR
ncbi:MAG: hypothetical protein JW900_05725 [Anaerolineae bacterium]|nr:hypothetical protein [Anaerolineae bacterium]